jgi:beta-galactosidase
MIRQNFNAHWMFSKDISSMMGSLFGESNVPVEVTLPHDAMILEKRSIDNVTGNAGAFYPGGNYLYTKTFQVSAEDVGKTMLLEFEGIYNRARVYINGAFAGACHYGYTNFYVNMTPHLNYGAENIITVNVTNQDVPNSRWYTGSGIYRPVHLLVGNTARIKQDGMKITTPVAAEDISTVETAITVQYDGVQTVKSYLHTQLIGADGTVAASEKTPVTIYHGKELVIRQRLFVYNAKLWSLEEPNLYTCVTKLTIDGKVQDESVESFGIRHIQVDPLYGLRLNGKRVMLRGSCIHHDNGVLGSATLARAEERRVEISKAAGFNSIRMAHNSASRALLDACDKLGVLVIEESYDMWNQSKNPFDYALNFANNWEEDIEAIVAKDFNHPSVFMYSVGNEIGEINRPAGAALNRALCEKFRTLDPTRYTTNAVNGLVATMSNIMPVMFDLGLITQEQLTAMTTPQPEGEQTSDGGDINDVMTSLMGQMNYLGTHPSVGEVLDETFSGMDICGYNYMSGRYPLDQKEYPNRITYGSETLPPDIDINWKYAKEIPQMLGDYTWTGWDYIGESGVGVPGYGELSGFFSPYPVYLAHVGDIDIIGFRRPMSYYREIVWGMRKSPYIAAQLPQHYCEKMNCTPWINSDCIESWSWPGFEGKSIKVEVYSDSEEVGLFLNGTSIGKMPTGEENRFKAIFDMVYQPGTLEAIGYTGGMETGRFAIQTAGDKIQLSINADRQTIQVDGLDAAYLMISITDVHGVVNTAADRKVTVEVSGAGTLQGFGSADPKSEENFYDTERTTYNGRALAVIRSGSEKGSVKVTVSADGCAPQTININVV